MSARLTWEAWGNRPGRRYALLADGKRTNFVVAHCGHPTAHWPYYISRERGDGFCETILAENGRGFRLLAYAKTHAEALYTEACSDD